MNADGLGPQILTVSDGYGLPILFASLFVYILMRLLVKPFLVEYLAKKGLDKEQRESWLLRSTFLPGLLAASFVDFTPIALAVGVPLHWIAAAPVGAVFYAAGGVAIHETLKRADPIGLLIKVLHAAMMRLGLLSEDAPEPRSDEELKQEAERHYRTATRELRGVPKDEE